MNQVSVTKQVADHLRRLRAERRWSARQLAEECARAGTSSLTRSAIAKIESGVRKSISVDELAALSKALGVSVDVLVGSELTSLPTMPSVKPATNFAETPRSFLDEPVEWASYDVEAIQQFRSWLRTEVAEKLSLELTPEEFLAQTHFLIDSRLTRTGALLFAKDPLGACPTAIVKCTLYNGNDRAASRESIDIDGTVPAQIFAARQFVTDRVRIGGVEGEREHEILEYRFSMIAVRELIVNALVHRDYAVADSCIHVRLFSDRLEVASPGRWYGRNLAEGAEYSMTSLAGQSIKRNFRLAHALSWIRLVEGEGSGIPTVLRDCEATSTAVPIVAQQDGFVIVTLYPRESMLNGHYISADQMIEWFKEHYEGPQHHVPFESREGGYQYGDDGPYDAEDVLREEFPYASEQAIADAVNWLEREGHEWVRKAGTEDSRDEDQ